MADNSFISVKKDTLVFVPKDFLLFIIYRITYVIALLHDNATTLRGLTCLILCLIYCSFKKSWCTKLPLGGGGGGGSIAIPKSTNTQYC